MATYHIRVCAVGTEADITMLLRVMLKNVGELETEEDGLEPVRSREQL